MRTMSLSNKPDTDPMELVQRAMALCKTPIKMSFERLFFEVDVPILDEERILNPEWKDGTTRRQAIVKHISGFVPPGQATFIIGSSGAGKTTLLNVMADRIQFKTGDKLSGTILLNDAIPVDKKIFARFGAYVEQFDALFSHFTVREALTFSARLKLKIPDEEQD